MAPKQPAKGKGKGKGKKPARPKPSPPPTPLVHAPKHVHIPNDENVLTLEHSLEIVKTIITATMLEIIKIRRVFPEHTWQRYAWDPADPSITYDSFIEGVEGKNRPNFEATDNLMIWHFPKRGSTPGLDKLLDCLESGAQDALAKGYLHKLNLSIAHVDDGPITEANLIESYTIKFSYESGNVVSQIYSETGEMHSQTPKPVVLLDAKNGARKLLDDVACYLWNSSKHGELKDYPLPPSFRMIMAMDYNDATPSDYQAPRFHQGDEHASRLINLGHFKEEYVMKTGYHSVAVGLHLPGPHQQSIRTRQPVDNGDPGPSRITPHVQNPVTPSVRARQHSVLSELGGGRTQPEAMRQIGGMGAFRQPNTDTQDTRPLYSQSFPATRASTKRRRTGHSQPRLRYPPYTQSIIDFLNSQADVNEAGAVDCDCGAEDDSGDFVYCSKCGSSHHAQCHGYLDGSHPTNVMCYWCLLHPEEGPDEDDLYKEMQRLCVKRRLLYYLLENNRRAHVKRLNEYASGNPDNIEVTVAFLAELERQGYLRIEVGLLTEKESVAFYTLVADEKTIRSNYFRPQQNISHHFAVPETPSSAQANDRLGIDDQSASSNPSLTAQNLPDSQGLTRATRRLLLAEASSTQDTPSHRSKSRSSSRTFSPTESPQTAMTSAVGLGSKKRAADSEVEDIPPKRRGPAVNSPWIRRIDGTEG